MLLGAFALVGITAACCNTKEYKPTCDATPVLAIKLTSPIDTLEDIPRSETYVADGVSLGDGRRITDTKESFGIDRDKTSFRFALFYSEASAEKEIANERSPAFTALHGSIFQEKEAYGTYAIIRYTERSCGRSDSPIPLCSCDDNLRSRAVFRVRNLVVTVEVMHLDQHANALTQATRELADLLSGSAFVSSILFP